VAGASALSGAAASVAVGVAVDAAGSVETAFSTAEETVAGASALSGAAASVAVVAAVDAAGSVETAFSTAEETVAGASALSGAAASVAVGVAVDAAGSVETAFSTAEETVAGATALLGLVASVVGAVFAGADSTCVLLLLSVEFSTALAVLSAIKFASASERGCACRGIAVVPNKVDNITREAKGLFCRLRRLLLKELPELRAVTRYSPSFRKRQPLYGRLIHRDGKSITHPLN
ncbi:MAG: hypothetical protein ABF421_02290, partial [Zymomonas mobilis subsp. pomaceae]